MKRFIRFFSAFCVFVICICAFAYTNAAEFTVTENSRAENEVCERHIYANNGEYTVVKEANCHSGGTMYRSCLVCGEKDIVQTPRNPDNHTLVSDRITYEVYPTCTEGGIGHYVCLDCNESVERFDVPPDPEAHAKEGDYVTVTPATCQTAGSMAYKCKHCGDFFNYQEIPVDPEAHVTTDSSEWNVTVLPGCSTEGKMECRCELCGAVAIVKSIPATGDHIPSEEWTVDADSTCVADGVKSQHCTVCNTPVNEQVIPMDSSKHTFDEKITTDVKPTCVSEGSQSRHCIYCDAKTDVQTLPVDANAHAFGEIWVVTKEATCSESGYQHSVCSLCSTESVSVIIPKTPHNYPEEYEIIRESADGLSAQVKYTCTDCGYENITIITFGENTGDGDIGDGSGPSIYPLIPTPDTVVKIDYENGTVTNVARNLNIEAFLKNFTNSHVFVIYNTKGEFVNEEDNIGTGYRLNYETVEGRVSNYYVSVTGDLDSDGKVTASDARLILRAAAKIDTPEGVFFTAADVNLDGNVNAADARKTLLVAANLTYFEETYAN